MINLVRRATCYNQGELAQFLYLSSYFHRELKNEMCASYPNQRNVEKKSKELINYLNIKFAQVTANNFAFCTEYFEKTDRLHPRVCLKGTFDGEIVDFFRNIPTGYSTRHSPESNSGFHEVIKNGQFFLANDLISKTFSGEYINPRLQQSIIEEYKEKNKTLNNKELIQTITNKIWLSFWSNSTSSYPKSNENSDCYQSTLIIPLTLRNITLSELFLELTNFPNVEREIMGFLCFDYHQKNFFNATDVDFGYIIADFLSLYIITRLNYTTQSDTYNGALQFVSTNAM